MISPSIHEAEAYFAALWQRTAPTWKAGSVSAANMKDGTTDPVDYCLSTVALVQRQDRDRSEFVRIVKSRLQAVDRAQFYYLPESTHITLLGCTQRFPTREAILPEVVRNATEACREVLHNRASVKMTLQGVGIIGNQIFIQVFPHDRRWAELRAALESALVARGLAPMSHPNKAPIHMNVGRVTDATPERLARLLDAIESMRSIGPNEFEVSTIDLLMTDFVISPEHTQQIARFDLTEQ
jgi:2'-5' RNA ligase